MRRQALLSYRDPTLYLSRFVMFMITSIFFAWVYVQARVRTQDQARAPSLLRCAPPASVRAFNRQARRVFLFALSWRHLNEFGSLSLGLSCPAGGGFTGRRSPSPGHWTGARPCDSTLLSSARPPRQVTNRMFLAVWFIGVPTRCSVFKFEIVVQLSPNVSIFSDFLMILLVKVAFLSGQHGCNCCFCSEPRIPGGPARDQERLVLPAVLPHQQRLISGVRWERRLNSKQGRKCTLLGLDTLPSPDLVSGRSALGRAGPNDDLAVHLHLVRGRLRHRQLSTVQVWLGERALLVPSPFVLS